jgi:hypothetical protein
MTMSERFESIKKGLEEAIAFFHPAADLKAMGAGKARAARTGAGFAEDY